LLSHTFLKTKYLTAVKSIGAIKSIMISHPVLTICGGIAVKVCISYAGYRFLKRASNKDKYLKLFRKNYT
jgi:hypothetical protein